MAEHCLSSFSDRAISPKAAISAVPDRSEIGPYLRGGSSQERGSCDRLAKVWRAPGVGRFLRKRHVCGAGPLGDRSLPWRLFGSGTRVLRQAGQGLVSSGGRAISPKAPISAVPDPSEIGPYPRGGSSQERGSCYRLTKARGALGVGRFLRKRQSLRCRTARRSVPTSEAVRVRNAGIATG